MIQDRDRAGRTTGLGVFIRAILGVAIVASAMSGTILPANADDAMVPGVPTRVVISNATRTSLDVSWSAPANNGGAAISDYVIQYRKVGTLSWKTHIHAATTATSAKITGLSAFSTYVVRIAAVNTAGTSEWNGEHTTIDVGKSHSCAVITDGSVVCWGSNGSGRLGNNWGPRSLQLTPVGGITGLSPALTAVSVSLGNEHSCALMVDGTLRCWGANGDGQLGNGSTTNSRVSVQVSGVTGLTPPRAPVQVSGVTGLSPAATAVSVSTSNNHSCALMANGTVQCWGNNSAGQLGDGTTDNSPVPATVAGITGLTLGTTAVNVSAGAFHSCAVMADGTAKCWGNNERGQLGDGTTNNSPVPATVTGITGLTPATAAVSVSASNDHSCALMAAGTAKCWGNNERGQLGNGSTTMSAVPVSVAGITGLTLGTTAVSVSTGWQTSCALMADSFLNCWGFTLDSKGKILTEKKPVRPIIQGNLVFSGISTGWNSSCPTYSFVSAAGYTSGHALCWGSNQNGELGNGWITKATNTAQAVRALGPGDLEYHLAVFSRTGRTLGRAPGAPGSVSAKPTKVAGEIAVTWTAPALNGGSRLYFYVSILGPDGKWNWPDLVDTGLTYTFGNLKRGTYSVKVIATTTEGSTSTIKSGIVLK